MRWLFLAASRSGKKKKEKEKSLKICCAPGYANKGGGKPNEAGIIPSQRIGDTTYSKAAK
jgi:hypothetical protein